MISSMVGNRGPTEWLTSARDLAAVGYAMADLCVSSCKSSSEQMQIEKAMVC